MTAALRTFQYSKYTLKYMVYLRATADLRSLVRARLDNLLLTVLRDTAGARAELKTARNDVRSLESHHAGVAGHTRSTLLAIKASRWGTPSNTALPLSVCRLSLVFADASRTVTGKPGRASRPPDARAPLRQCAAAGPAGPAVRTLRFAPALLTPYFVNACARAADEKVFQPVPRKAVKPYRARRTQVTAHRTQPCQPTAGTTEASRH
jgi:hypothetical protein